MDSAHDSSCNEKLLSGYHLPNHPGHPPPIPDPRGHEYHYYPPMRQVPPSMCQRATSNIFKVAISVLISLLMVLVFLRVGYDTYPACMDHMDDGAADMRNDQGGMPWNHHAPNHWPGYPPEYPHERPPQGPPRERPPHSPPHHLPGHLGHPPHHHAPEHPPHGSHHRPDHPSHHPEHPPHRPENPSDDSDCRKAGCEDGSACVKLSPPVPCITELCPPERFVCLPLAAPDDSTDSHIPAAPETNGPGRKNKFKEFFACIEEHDGSVVWNHPTEPCNNCRCLPGGGISCTKKLCSDNVATEEAANSIVYVVDVAV